MNLSAGKALLTGWATAGRALIGQYLSWVYAAIALAVLVAAGWSVWRVMSWREGFQEREKAVAAQELAERALKAEQDCLEHTACAGRAIKAATDGAAAVESARKAAAEAASKEQARVAAEGQAAVQRAEKAASVAAVRLRDAEARLRKSLAEDATCAAQAAEVIKCDY